MRTVIKPFRTRTVSRVAIRPFILIIILCAMCLCFGPRRPPPSATPSPTPSLPPTVVDVASQPPSEQQPHSVDVPVDDESDDHAVVESRALSATGEGDELIEVPSPAINASEPALVDSHNNGG
ncbi:MAG: hypothetical protein QF415_03070 [Candidatus Undinarchaeales archaeon]|nr:hypothetical protein [Candidatus Undinarchaeales archaeon]MDP7492805.1 hypothetical protein [Candidatus Undinarchaeales archaeon]